MHLELRMTDDAAWSPDDSDRLIDALWSSLDPEGWHYFPLTPAGSLWERRDDPDCRIYAEFDGPALVRLRVHCPDPALPCSGRIDAVLAEVFGRRRADRVVLG